MVSFKNVKSGESVCGEGMTCGGVNAAGTIEAGTRQTKYPVLS